MRTSQHNISAISMVGRGVPPSRQRSGSIVTVQFDTANPSPLPSPHRMGRGNVPAAALSMNGNHRGLREVTDQSRGGRNADTLVRSVGQGRNSADKSVRVTQTPRKTDPSLRENLSLSPRQWGEGRGEGPRRPSRHGSARGFALSMNRPSGAVTKLCHICDKVSSLSRAGSWSQCAAERLWKLPPNWFAPPTLPRM